MTESPGDIDKYLTIDDSLYSLLASNVHLFFDVGT